MNNLDHNYLLSSIFTDGLFRFIDPSSVSDHGWLSEEFSLLWYDHTFWQWKLTANHRGCFRIGPPFLETGDLLGFFQKRRHLSHSVEIIIYPKPISLNFISSPLKELFGKTGVISPVKDPVYPVATQDYYHGDPAKYIHWKASARHDRLQTKIFEPSSQRKTLLIIDVSTFRKNKHEGTFEKTLEVIAAAAMEFDRQGSPYGVLSNGKICGNGHVNLAMATGPEQLSMAMELLARIKMDTAFAIEEILFKDNLIPAGTGCIYCAHSLNRKNTRIAQFLREHHIPVYFIITRAPHQTNNQQINFFLLDEIHGGVLEHTKNL